MTKFLKAISTVIAAYLAIIILVRLIWICTMPHLLDKDVISDEIHTIVIGASNGEASWDDSIIPGSMNLCQSANSFSDCYTSLLWADQYNHADIDTVLFCASLPMFLYTSDEKLETLDRIKLSEARSILDYKGFFDHFKSKGNYWKLVAASIPNMSKHAVRGGFLHLDRDKVESPHAYDVINSHLEEIGGYNGFSKDYIINCRDFSVEYFRKIKDYCTSHGITMVILCPPVYRIPELVSDNGYIEFLMDELGPEGMIADYSDLRMPELSYYGDLEHLNYKGAEYFSRMVAQEGLRVLPLGQHRANSATR